MKRRVRLNIRGTEVAVVRRHGESESEAPTVKVTGVIAEGKDPRNMQVDLEVGDDDELPF